VPYAIDEDVTVESTPGHTSQDITVYVNTTKQGIVAVTGELPSNSTRKSNGHSGCYR